MSPWFALSQPAAVPMALLSLAALAGCAPVDRVPAADPTGQSLGATDPVSMAVVADRDCDDFTVDLEHTVDQLLLKRASGWKFPDLRNGMFLGTITNQGNSKVDLFPKVTIGVRESGCIYARLVNNGSGAKEDLVPFWHPVASGGGKTKGTRLNGLACWHDPHPEDVRPSKIDKPHDCKAVFMTALVDQSVTTGWTGDTVTVTVHVRAADGTVRPGDEAAEQVVGPDMIRDAFVQRLSALRPDVERSAVVAAAESEVAKAFAPGFWFPCVFTGCCRAY